MKIAFLIVLFLFSFLTSNSQGYDFRILDFPKPNNVKEIDITDVCQTCNPKTQHTFQHIFDNLGRLMRSKEEESTIEFTYYSDNKIQSMRVYGQWIYGYTKDLKQTKEWDSATLSFDKYYYESHKLIKHEYYDRNRLDHDIKYVYDSRGNLITEIETYYPDPNSFGYFKANSDKLDPSVKIDNRTIVYKKQYAYNKDTTIFKFYDRDTVSFIEKEVKNNQGRTIEIQNMDNKSNLRYKTLFTYNERLLAEIKMINSGYKNTGDTALGDDYVYSYDANGHLNKEDTYDKGRLITTKKITYILLK